MTIGVEKPTYKSQVFCCFKPKRPHAIICAILWTIFLALSLIASIMMLIETKYGAELLNEDYTEEMNKRKHLHNGTVVIAANEAKLCGNMEKAIYMVSSMYQMCDISAINFLGAIFVLHSVIKSKPLYSVPFFFASLITGISGTVTFFLSGYWRELMLLSKQKLFYLSCLTSAVGILLLSIWVPLAIYSVDQLNKLLHNAARMATIKHNSCGGLTHTVKAKPLPKKITLSNEKI